MCRLGLEDMRSAQWFSIAWVLSDNICVCVYISYINGRVKIYGN